MRIRRPGSRTRIVSAMSAAARARHAATAAASTATPVRMARSTAIPRTSRHSTWRRSRAERKRDGASPAVTAMCPLEGLPRLPASPPMWPTLFRPEEDSSHETRHRNPDRRRHRQGRAFPGRRRRRGQGGRHPLHGRVRPTAGARPDGRAAGGRGLCGAGPRSLLPQRRLWAVRRQDRVRRRQDRAPSSWRWSAAPRRR